MSSAKRYVGPQKHLCPCFSLGEVDCSCFCRTAGAWGGSRVYSNVVRGPMSLLGGEQHCPAKASGWLVVSLGQESGLCQGLLFSDMSGSWECS